MSTRKSKPIDYASLESIELVWLAQSDDDRLADHELLTRKEEIMRRLVRNCVRKYTFVDPDDLYQSLVIAFMKVVRAYRPGRHGNGWDKYCYISLTNRIKDILRQRDDLGIKWPQKKHYPKWFHLYDKSDSASGSDNVYANSLGDHRNLSEQDADDLEFYESISDLRDSLIACRCTEPTSGAKSASHDNHPAAWCDRTESEASEQLTKPKYCWLPAAAVVDSKSKRKTAGVVRTIEQWRSERTKPKQMALWS